MPQPYNKTKKAYGKKTSAQRSSRNKARAIWEKKHGPCNGDVNHKDGNPENNALSNLECVSQKANRGWRGQKGGAKKYD